MNFMCLKIIVLFLISNIYTCATKLLSNSSTNVCLISNITSLIRQKYQISNQTERNKFDTLEKLFNDAFNCNTSLLHLPIGTIANPLDGRTFSFVTDILFGVADTVGFSNLYYSVKDGVSSAVTCLACQVIMNLLTISLISKETLSFAIIQVCVALRLTTSRVCYGIVDSFEDQVDYIRLNTKLTPNEMCGILLGVQCAVGKSNNLYWKIDVPKRGHSEHSSSATSNQRKDDNSYNILHVTDIHLDPLYRNGTVSHCGEPLCCHLSNGLATAGGMGSGVWGTYPCDIPYQTMENGLTRAREVSQRANANLWYWTGDAVAHDIWQYKRSSNLLVSEVITTLFKVLAYDGVRIIPAVGNHETVPVNSFPPPEITNEFSLSWLYDALAKQWSDWLPEHALETLRLYGSYSLLIRSGFRIITINSNYCARLNIWSLYDPIDPANHLLWLIEELIKAEQAKDTVHIVGHVPPDNRECTQAWLYNYLAIVERFKDTITGQFYGHTHADEFRVLYSNNNYSRPIGYEMLSPSLTTFDEFNPAFRIFNTDSKGNVRDFHTFSFKLTEANLNYLPKQAPNWYHEYSMSDLYSMNDFTYNGWSSFVNKLISDDTVLAKYYSTYYRGATPGQYCDRKCKIKFITDIVIINPFVVLPKPIWSTG